MFWIIVGGIGLLGAVLALPFLLAYLGRDQELPKQWYQVICENPERFTHGYPVPKNDGKTMFFVFRPGQTGIDFDYRPTWEEYNQELQDRWDAQKDWIDRELGDVPQSSGRPEVVIWPLNLVMPVDQAGPSISV